MSYPYDESDQYERPALSLRVILSNCFSTTNEVFGEPLQKATMSFRRNRPNGSKKTAGWEHYQKANADERGSPEAAGSEIRITWSYHLIKAPGLVMKLRAHSTDKKISVEASL